MTITLDAGDVRCHVLEDGTRPVSPRFVFKGYDEAVHGPFVEPYLDAEGMLAGRLTALLIEAENGIVLVDAGIGRFAGDLDAGHALQQMSDLGVRPWEVRTVIITHGHADHVGGLLGPEGSPVFADARHLVHRAEAAFWATDKAAALPRGAGEPAAKAFDALLDADLLDLIDGSTDAGRGVRVIEAPGHTPGHLAVVVGEALLWAGDALTAMLNVTHPEWVSAADMDGATNEVTRRALLGLAADRRLLLASVHMPVEVRVVRDGDGFAIDASA